MAAHPDGQGKILASSIQQISPEKLQASYSKLQTWICSALETYKQELLSISFPIMQADGGNKHATSFFKTWSADHSEHFPTEIRSLAMVTKKDQMKNVSLVGRLLSERYIVNLCTTSYRLLMNFLSNHDLQSIIQILNDHMKINIEDRAAKPKFEGAQLSGTADTAREGGASSHDILWAVPRGAKEEASAPKSSQPDSYNAHLIHKLSSRPRKFLSYEYSTPAESEAGMADASNPTLLMCSLTNTYRGLTCTRITEDATQLAGGFQDRAIRVFRLVAADGVPEEPFEEAAYPPSSQSGDGAAPMDIDGDEDLPAGPGMMILRGHTGAVHGLSWSPEQQFLLSGSVDSTVRLWDVATGKNLVVYPSISPKPIWDVAFAPLGQYFIAGGYDRCARLYSADQLQCVRLFVGHYSDVTTVAWHPNCNYVVTGSWDKTARLWDVQSGHCLRIYSGHFGPLTAVAVSPNGKYVAGAGGGVGGKSTIRIWDIRTGKEMASLEGHKGTINRLAYTNQGTVLASGASDCTVRTWELKADFDPSLPPATLTHHHSFRTKNTPVYDVCFTERNLLLASGPS